MTENEAIKILKGVYSLLLQCRVSFENVHDYKEASEEAIKALEEVQQYRKLGTVEEVGEAVEKEKEKKPNLEGDGYADGQMVYDAWICPNCGQSYEVDYDDYKCCPNCGQKIDWSKE